MEMIFDEFRSSWGERTVMGICCIFKFISE